MTAMTTESLPAVFVNIKNVEAIQINIWIASVLTKMGKRMFANFVRPRNRSFPPPPIMREEMCVGSYIILGTLQFTSETPQDFRLQYSSLQSWGAGSA